MSDFDLHQEFNTIFCCDAFFHNLTVNEQISCLRCVARHLTPAGHFLFNLPDPSCEFILKATASCGKIYEERGRYPFLDGSGFLLVEQAQGIDIQEQLVTTTLRFTRYDQDGRLLDKGESSWLSRYLHRYEAVHLLSRCGFSVVSLVGDYKNGPVTEAGQLIFDAVPISS